MMAYYQCHFSTVYMQLYFLLFLLLIDTTVTELLRLWTFLLILLLSTVLHEDELVMLQFVTLLYGHVVRQNQLRGTILHAN